MESVYICTRCGPFGQKACPHPCRHTKNHRSSGYRPPCHLWLPRLGFHRAILVFRARVRIGAACTRPVPAPTTLHNAAEQDHRRYRQHAACYNKVDPVHRSVPFTPYPIPNSLPPWKISSATIHAMPVWKPTAPRPHFHEPISRTIAANAATQGRYSAVKAMNA